MLLKDSPSRPVGADWRLQDIMTGTDDMKFPKQERRFYVKEGKSPIHCLHMDNGGLERHRTMCNVGKSICPLLPATKSEAAPLPLTESRGRVLHGPPCLMQ